MNSRKHFDEVGDTIAYPQDVYEVTFLEEYTFEQAMNAIVEVAPGSILGVYVSAHDIKASGDRTRFLNKLAVCIEVTSHEDSIAIYKQRGKYYKIRARRSRK